MAKIGVKSFTKAPKKDLNIIPGTKQNPSNFSLLTSCGLQALDTILGGGLPIGSILMIEEDESNLYAETIAKYFISEGILCNHRTILAGKDANFDQLLKSLPGPVQNDDKKMNQSPSEMTIAWRYEHLQIADTSIDGKNSFGHKLALNAPLDASIVSLAKIEKWDKNDENLITDLTQLLKNEKNQVSRLALLNFASPLWDESKISQKFYQLRSLLRQSLAVALITIPSYLNNQSQKWSHFCDISIRLESFTGTPLATNAAFKDYHGFLRIIKLPAFNSIAPHIPPSDLAFRLRRRTLVIERLSLPPELDDTAARESTSCSGGLLTAKNLDF